MTFSASSVENSGRYCLLLLTHCRGGAVLIFRQTLLGLVAPSVQATPSQISFCDRVNAALSIDSSGLPLNTLLLRLAQFQEQDSKPQAPDAAFRSFVSSENDFSLSLSSTTTAECLAEMYMRGLSDLGISDKHVSHIVMGVGPGSFTGLRLGCAFANGLALGRGRVLTQVPCVLPSIVDTKFRNASLLFEGMLSSLSEDEFSRLIHVGDVILAIRGLYESTDENLVEFVPAYGREPGPVLKLRAELAFASSARVN